jgi:hypothetical protein
MAQVWRLKPEAYVDISPAGFVGASGYGLCDEVDNSTSPYQSAWVYVSAAFTAVTGTAGWFHFAIQTAPDGTNYHDADTLAFQEKVVASLKANNATAIKWAFYIPQIPPK